MSEGNVYKPRYKLAFQAKSKIWPYKNSRLRRFFNIRGRKLIRRGLFKRYVLVFNNMKWTIARRYIRPYMRRRSAVRRKYKDIFYTKQQLRAFYGKVKEQTFRTFFHRYINNAKNRNRSFYAALETRLDMVLFRMRVLPTIFACNQLIHHHGVLVNNAVEKSPNALVLPGDIVALQKNQWTAIKPYMYERAWYRAYGFYIMTKRQYSLLKKKGWWAIKRNVVKVSGQDLIASALKISRLYRQTEVNFKEINQRILYNISKVDQNFTQNNVKLKNDLELILNRVVSLEKSFRFFYRKALLSIKSILGRKNKFGWWARSKQLTLLFRKVILIYSNKKNLAYISLKLKLEELSLYQTLISTIKENDKKESLLNLINERKTILIEKYVLFKNKLENQLHFFLRRKLRKYMLKPFKRASNFGEKKVAFSNSLIFFLKNRRFKKQRRLQISRLKPVHWYIPPYIHVDFRTLRGVFLYNPLPHEITYSFKVSLPKIYSFYKSRGI